MLINASPKLLNVFLFCNFYASFKREERDILQKRETKRKKRSNSHTSLNLRKNKTKSRGLNEHHLGSLKHPMRHCVDENRGVNLINFASSMLSSTFISLLILLEIKIQSTSLQFISHKRVRLASMGNNSLKS